MLNILESIIEGEYAKVSHGDVLHLVPFSDVDDHFIPDCKCGMKTVEIDGVVVAYIHASHDKRELLTSLSTLTLDEAIIVRKQYKANLDRLLKEGLISTRTYSNKGKDFNSTFEEIFRAN